MGRKDPIAAILAEIAGKEGCSEEEFRAEIDHALQLAFAAKTPENAALWEELGDGNSCPDAANFIAAATERLMRRK